MPVIKDKMKLQKLHKLAIFCGWFWFMFVMTAFQCSTEVLFRNDMAAAEHTPLRKKQKFAEAVKGMDPETRMYSMYFLRTQQPQK